LARSARSESPEFGISDSLCNAADLKREASMSSTVWAVQAAHIWRRETHIFRFLRDARCAARVVEVRLFKTSRLSDRVPIDTRRWEPGSDLAKTAKEISEYIADSGSVDATIVASDEISSPGR
jgi:hypothetical protein